jgi:hypothetical protein
MTREENTNIFWLAVFYVLLNIPASWSSDIKPYYLFTGKLHTYSSKLKQEISALVTIITRHG